MKKQQLKEVQLVSTDLQSALSNQPPQCHTANFQQKFVGYPGIGVGPRRDSNPSLFVPFDHQSRHDRRRGDADCSESRAELGQFARRGRLCQSEQEVFETTQINPSDEVLLNPLRPISICFWYVRKTS